MQYTSESLQCFMKCNICKIIVISNIASPNFFFQIKVVHVAKDTVSTLFLHNKDGESKNWENKGKNQPVATVEPQRKDI